MFSGTNLTLGGQSTVDGDAGSNGNFDTGGQGTVTGGVNAAGKITVSGQGDIGGTAAYGTGFESKSSNNVTFSNTGSIHPFPTQDMTAWRVYAQQNGGYYNNDLMITGIQAFSSNVVYVKGNVHFSGQSIIQGKVTIVAEGTIFLSGHVTTNPPSTTDTVNLSLLAANGITFSGQTNIDAICYAHGVQNVSDFSGTGQATVNGAVIADTVGNSGQFNIHYRKAGSPVLPPITNGSSSSTNGASSSYQWNIASWELLK
jgi:hypothetical protein